MASLRLVIFSLLCNNVFVASYISTVTESPFSNIPSKYNLAGIVPPSYEKLLFSGAISNRVKSNDEV